MRLVSTLLTACAVTAGSSLAQDFNIDLGSPTSPFGVPSSSYGGAAERPGVWHEVTTEQASNLVATDGSSTAASLTMQINGIGYFYDKDDAGTAGDDEALLDDSHQSYPNTTYRFDDLQPGHYRVYTIGIRLYPNAFQWDVEGLGALQPPGYVTGKWNGAHAMEQTYFVHDFIVGSAGSLSVRVISEEPLHDNAQVSGFQLELVQEPGGAYCYGFWFCPCNNSDGGAGGCVNSTGVGGLLVGSGSTSVGADDLRFSALQLPSKQFAILFTGPDTNGWWGHGTALGDGVLCVSGSLKRFDALKSTASGQAFWGPGLGATGAWSAGDTRYFQAWFRDPNGPCGTGSNLTNAYAVIFTP